MRPQQPTLCTPSFSPNLVLASYGNHDPVSLATVLNMFVSVFQTRLCLLMLTLPSLLQFAAVFGGADQNVPVRVKSAAVCLAREG